MNQWITEPAADDEVGGIYWITDGTKVALAWFQVFDGHRWTDLLGNDIADAAVHGWMHIQYPLAT